MTDMSTADVESAAEGVSVEVFAIRSDFLFLELTGVVKISAIPEIQNKQKLSKRSSREQWLVNQQQNHNIRTLNTRSYRSGLDLLSCSSSE